MKNYFLFTVLALFSILSSCHKIEVNEKASQNYIIAGEKYIDTYQELNLKYSVDIDSIAYSKYSHGSHSGDLLNIFKIEENYDFRIMQEYTEIYGMNTSISYFFDTRHDLDYQIAVEPKRVASSRKGVMRFAKLFNHSDTINSTDNWLNLDSVAYISYFNKLDSYFVDEDEIENMDVIDTINRNAENKFVGVRYKSEGKVLYGWIKISIYNHNSLEINQSCTNEPK